MTVVRARPNPLKLTVTRPHALEHCRTRLSPYVASLDVLRSCTNTTEASRLFASSPATLSIQNASAPITLNLPSDSGKMRL